MCLCAIYSSERPSRSRLRRPVPRPAEAFRPSTETAVPIVDQRRQFEFFLSVRFRGPLGKRRRGAADCFRPVGRTVPARLRDTSDQLRRLQRPTLQIFLRHQFGRGFRSSRKGLSMKHNHNKMPTKLLSVKFCLQPIYFNNRSFVVLCIM